MPSLARLRRPLLWVTGTLLALALVLTSHPDPRRAAVPEPMDMGVVSGQVVPKPARLQAPHRLRLALELEDLRGLDLSTKTFKAQGQLRLAWDQALDARMREWKLDPVRLVRFVNQVEGWNGIFEAAGPPLRIAAAPSETPGGSALAFTQTVRFEGLFYVNGFDLHRAPFLHISLPLILEVADPRLALENDGLLLDPPQDPSRQIGRGVSMAGFQLVGRQVEAGLHRRADPFEPGRFQTLSRMALSLEYRTNRMASALRWIVPLLLVMAVVLMAPSLDSGRDDLSFSLPSAGLLTLAVMQEGYRSQVPATPYLTFLDELYTYSYAVAVAVFLLFVWGGNLRARATDDVACVRRVNRLCSLVQGSALLGYGVLLLAYLPRWGAG